MRFTVLFSIVLAFVLVPSVASACGGSSGCGHGASHDHAAAGDPTAEISPPPQHGGYVFAGTDLRYEIATEGRLLRIYAYDDSDQPVDLRGVDGVIRRANDSGGNEADIAFKYQPGHHGRSGWLIGAIPPRESPPALGEYQILLRNLPSHREREISIDWPREVASEDAGSPHAGHQH